MLNGKQFSMVMLALAKAGAKWTPVYRQPKDANGVASGEPEQIGCILGLRYRKGSAGNTIHIDIPGTIVRTESDRFEGIARGECPGIQKGDWLLLCQARRNILDAQEVAPGLYILILDEEL